MGLHLSGSTVTALNNAYVGKASGLDSPATLLPRAVASGNISWAANPTMNFNPRAVGIDGQLYYTYLGTQLGSSADPTLTVRTTGPDFSPKTPNTIVYATKTTAGYVVITNNSGTDVANIYFCHASAGFSTNLADWTMVQSLKAVTAISIAKPRVIAGTSWLVVGEYTTGVYPSIVRKLWLSTDGGMTWTAIRDSRVVDNTVNSHWHNAVITASGRIYASQGDGASNNWFGYSDDRGATWVSLPFDAGNALAEGGTTYQQPTQMLDFGEMVACTPDSGNTLPAGVWSLDPDTGLIRNRASLASGEVAWKQYGTGSCQRGREGYVTFPDQSSGSNRTYILGTGDYGRTWTQVSSIDTTGGAASGRLVGPDANGKVYMQPTASIPTYGTGIMIGTLPTWAWKN